jgi:hypothetical protein
VSYTIPLPPEGIAEEKAGVLSIVQHGRPIITFPHQKVETFLEVSMAHVPQAERSEPWTKRFDTR